MRERATTLPTIAIAKGKGKLIAFKKKRVTIANVMGGRAIKKKINKVKN